MELQQKLKWKGKATAKVIGASPDNIWPLFQDFCNLHKWLPNVTTCYKVDGISDQPGCVRYCAGPGVQSDSGNGVAWATEKIVAIDPIRRLLSYEIVDNNIGFGEYVATIKVLPDSGEGCCIEWSYVADPVGSWSEEQFLGYIQLGLESMAEKMEEALGQEEAIN